jgi:hypothetical protein
MMHVIAIRRELAAEPGLAESVYRRRHRRPRPAQHLNRAPGNAIFVTGRCEPDFPS